MDWNTITPVVTFILGLLGKVFYDSWQEKRKIRKDSLRIHFDDMRRKIVDGVSEMSGSLEIRNNRLVFGTYSPVEKEYDFERENYYASFEIHFSERAKEWKQLNGEALKLKELLEKLKAQERDIGTLQMIKKVGGHSIDEDKLNSNLKEQEETYENIKMELSHSLGHLQSEFGDFSRRLADEVESIDKYQMGVGFRYDKKCPICQKF